MLWDWCYCFNSNREWYISWGFYYDTELPKELKREALQLFFEIAGEDDGTDMPFDRFTSQQLEKFHSLGWEKESKSSTRTAYSKYFTASELPSDKFSFGFTEACLDWFKKTMPEAAEIMTLANSYAD